MDCHELQGRAQGDETKIPATVMIFGVVSSEGHIMPRHNEAVGGYIE